ncbi:MAG: hypothetical protein ACR2RF_09210 [Geminicoccaceae bacterium]
MILLGDLFYDQKGDAAIQYALVAGILSLAVLVGSLTLREQVVDLYTQMSSQANGALAGQPTADPSEGK